ncbi:MAG TPA: hemerythrin domain-containing protein [Casimicrobiaceae bacterium]|jgi:hemerythrin-like domain-containing protein|nr:hemerythrin domain-containing protein [Casimicrobiaceae bacterium]
MSVNLASDIIGLSASAAGFEAPLEMLATCHVRMRTQCSTLLRLGSHVAVFGADDAARTVARHVMRYFDCAAHYHHEDEEQDLFPALLESMAGSDAICIRHLIDSLTVDHRELERLWDVLKAWLVRVEARDAVSAEAGEISLFADLYDRHIAREEQELLPMAARLLGSSDLDRIGHAMRLRREITST